MIQSEAVNREAQVLKVLLSTGDYRVIRVSTTIVLDISHSFNVCAYICVMSFSE